MLKEISIEIIRKCPNKCVHCSSLSNEMCTEIIPFEQFKKMVKGAKELGLKTVCFSGGEPFLHPDIVEMVDYVYSLGLSSYIYSSGIYMDQEGIRTSIPVDIMQKLSGKVTKVIFNVEAADETTYNYIMGSTGCFGLLKESIVNAAKLKLEVEGHFVPMKVNKDQIEKTLILCKELGVSKVSFLRLVMHGRALENEEKIMLSEKELKEVEEILLPILNDNKYAIRIGVPLLGETKEYHCEAANGKLNIRYDGKVYPCEVFKNNRLDILNGITPPDIFDDDIINIYKNSAYLKEVRKMVSAFSHGGHCEKCVGQYYIKQSGSGK